MPVGLSSCSDSQHGNEPTIDLFPVALTENGNWSMLDRSGKIIYEDEFSNKPEPATEGVFSVMEGHGYTLYKVGKDNPEPLEGCEGIKQAGVMVDGVIPVVFPGERIQLRDKDGKKICDLGPFDGMEVEACNTYFSEGLLAVHLMNDTENTSAWGFVNKKGELAFKQTFANVNDFKDGVAVCWNGLESSEGNCYIVIDRTGKTLFEIDYDLQPFNFYFNGRLLLYCIDNGDLFFADKSGKKVKLPSKINDVSAYNEKYIIFTSIDGDFGVADLDGNICIRPKYRKIKFGVGDQFIAQKNGNDAFYIINAKGDVLHTLDYSYLNVVNDFCYVAREGKRYILLDKNMKQIGDEDFVNVNYEFYQPEVASDYYNPDVLASRIVSLIHKDGFGETKFGDSALQLLGESVAHQNITNPVHLYKYLNGYRYDGGLSGFFTKRPVKWEDGEYCWNNDAKLFAIRLDVDVPSGELIEQFNVLTKHLKDAGFHEIGSEESKDGTKNKIWFSRNRYASRAELGLYIKNNSNLLLDVIAPEKPEDEVDEQ